MKFKPVFALLFSLTVAFSVKAEKIIYKDATQPVEMRVKDLLSRMTLDEKIDQLNMKGLSALKMNAKGEITDSSLVALFQGGSVGCLESPFLENTVVAKYSEAADNYLRTKTRLGIPAIQIAECLHGQMALGATIFPQAVNMGSTWNTALIKEMSSIIAKEASLSGVDQALSPVFDLARDPRYGRVEECYGEDPFLVKEMGVAFVTGMQGEAEQTKIGLEEGKIACTAKHFVAYSVPEAGINIAPSYVGERNLREWHFVPFEAVVKDANIYSLMPGYHEVDGVPVHKSKWLLNEVLRKEWGFGGYVFSDYGAIDMVYSLHFTTASKRETALQSLTAGVDLEAPSRNIYNELKGLVEDGEMSEDYINQAVSRVLTTKFKMGLFDRPYKMPKNLAKITHKDESVALSQKIAEESIVLLKNDAKTLPLKRDELKNIAVIGPNADKVQFGDYSITRNNDYGRTILQGITSYASNTLKVNYAEGCGISSLSKDGFSEAVELAKNSDVIVLAAGGTSSIISGIGWGDQNSKELSTCGEGFDRNELNLPGVQEDLLTELDKTGKPIVLVLLNGRAYTLEKASKQVDAIVEAWYPGEKGGDAVARVLFGDVNPSGKLPVTFPPTTGHISIYANYKPSGRGFYKQRGTPENPGRDYVFSAPEPLYCFGHGLSYTEFEYSDIKVENNDGDNVIVSFNIQNTGDCDGAEVAQLYVRDKVSSVTTPMRALKGFEKVFLKKGDSKRIEIAVAKKDLMLWNIDMQRVLEPGGFEVHVGASTEDIRLSSEFEIK